ncbi:MAG: glycerol-3-phosphate transporter [Rhizobium sp.]|nr:glycerol-3-phosphate transporter [Rhizobium sp.]
MTSTRRWPLALGLVLLVYLAAVFTLYIRLPVKDGAVDWFAPLIRGGWMAWSFPSALFFLTIALLLAVMAVWEYASPGGNPRVGVLRFETTRGDRLFISLLGSAFIHLAWLGLVGANLWWALVLSVVYAVGVFKLV